MEAPSVMLPRAIITVHTPEHLSGQKVKAISVFWSSQLQSLKMPKYCDKINVQQFL